MPSCIVKSCCYTMKKPLLLFFLLPVSLQAQEVDSLRDFSSQTLQEITVKAYGSYVPRQDAPATLGLINSASLSRQSDVSIVSAMNQIPGVRMEERSPGSLRLSMRGSALRAPFGVRNIKIYYNDIPITDPGGHTYLNQFGFYNLRHIEVLKGPGSSLYGAGTGGVLLIESMAGFPRGTGGALRYTGGSYGLQQFIAQAFTRSQEKEVLVQYQQNDYDGYRAHSAAHHTVVSLDAAAKLSDYSSLSGHFLYSDLKYQTPGALTLAEYEADPRAARPATPFSISAADAGAAILQKNFLAGTTLSTVFSQALQNTTTVYGAYNQLLNPTIRNYARASEVHTGGRTTFSLNGEVAGVVALRLLLGGELQQNFTSVRTYGNTGGAPDGLQSDDELKVLSYFAFTQLSAAYRKWTFTAGLSLNRSKLSDISFMQTPVTEYERQFDNELAPRLTLQHRFNSQLSIYAGYAKGFSPPTTSELAPSGGAFNQTLLPELGHNYELGLRANALDEALSAELTGFYFSLDNTIVVRRDAQGGEYFVNAGHTRQPGLEAALQYRLPFSDRDYPVNVWGSYTLYQFRYAAFVQAENDYSGNQLPGVAPHTLAAGIDADARWGGYGRLTFFYSDRIALNDANDAFAAAYSLLGLRLGYHKRFARHYYVDLFAGADNLLDQRYSLGNDINGFGGRYYNAAPGRNFYVGIGLERRKM